MTDQSKTYFKEEIMNIDIMKKYLNKGGFDIVKESRLSNGSGTQIRLENKAIVNVYDKGTYHVQGKNTQQVEKYLEDCTSTESSSTAISDKTFVGDGHYKNAKLQIVRKYEWDESKRVANIAKHKIDFDAVNCFVWRTAMIEPSPRGGEMRFAATGYIGEQKHLLVFTPRDECKRIISLRRANGREVWKYERNRTESGRANL